MAKEREIPTDPFIDFTICDNTLNRYKGRVIVQGIKLDAFMKNPVAPKQHNTSEVAIGKWSNLRVENNALLGRLHFDPNDEDAVQLYWKYKDGFMSAVSLHVLILETSSDPSLLLPGQILETVTKSELIEISTVTVPGQGNAVKLLSPDGNEYKLNLVVIESNSEKMSGQKTVEQLTLELTAAQNEIAALKKLTAEQLILLHKQRGVVTEAETASLLELALVKFDTVKLMLEAKQPAPATPQPADNGSREAMADALVKLHFDRGAITAPQKEFYRNAAVLNYEGAATLLQSLPGSAQLQSAVLGLGGQQSPTPAEDRKDWKYLDWWKRDQKGLEAMKLSAPEKYKALEAACIEDGRKNGIINTEIE